MPPSKDMVIARKTIKLTIGLEQDPYVTSTRKQLVLIKEKVIQQDGITRGLPVIIRPKGIPYRFRIHFLFRAIFRYFVIRFLTNII